MEKKWLIIYEKAVSSNLFELLFLFLKCAPNNFSLLLFEYLHWPYYKSDVVCRLNGVLYPIFLWRCNFLIKFEMN